MAPEVIVNSEGYTEKADVWSVGITAIEVSLPRSFVAENAVKHALTGLALPRPAVRMPSMHVANLSWLHDACLCCMQMATGAPPHSHLPPMKALFVIPKEPPPRLEGGYSPEFKSFVAACLSKEADARPAARELLQHPFITGVSTCLPSDILCSHNSQILEHSCLASSSSVQLLLAPYLLGRAPQTCTALHSHP